MTAAEPPARTVAPAVRRVMQANRSRDTAHELAVRSRLHALGLRYRVASPLPFDRRRRADVFLSRVGIYVFLDGCYWHGCPEHFVEPKTNVNFWRAKIAGNRARDLDTTLRLQGLGFEVLRFWEHSDPDDVAAMILGAYFAALGADLTRPCRSRAGTRGAPVAIIRSFEPGRQALQLHRTEVDCYHQTVTASDGSIYLHLTTFGSDGREVPGKSSQSLQLSAASALELAVIIESTFGLPTGDSSATT